MKTIANAPKAALSRLSTEGRAGLSSLGWMGLGQFAGLSIRLVSNVVLARVLAPDVYGILGAALAVLTTLEWLSDLGIQPALVRHPKGAEPSYLMTGWWMGVARGLALTSVAAALALPYAVFTKLPALAGILAALALRPALIALRSPGMPALRKRLHYRSLFVEELTQTGAGTIVSLALALATHSIWAIVWGTLAGACSAVAVSYVLCPMRPRPLWDREAAREIGHLGRQVLINTMVMALWLNMDRLLGPRFIPLAEMGIYAVAWNLAAVLEGLVTRACDVYFSMLSRRGDALGQAAWHEAVCRKLTWLALPLGPLAIGLAPFLIRLLYDSRYAAASPLFALLVARLLIRTLGQVQFQYLMARAEVHVATRAYLVALAVQAALFAGLVPAFGATGLALAALGSTTALTFVQSWCLERRTGAGLGGFAITFGAMSAGLAVVMLLS